jgi:hypothetical protein
MLDAQIWLLYMYVMFMSYGYHSAALLLLLAVCAIYGQ